MDDYQQAITEFKGLSLRARNCLFSEGIKTKNKLMEILNRAPDELLRIPNLGYVSFAEILAWSGVVYKKPEKENKSIEKAIALLQKHGYTVIKG